MIPVLSEFDKSIDAYVSARDKNYEFEKILKDVITKVFDFMEIGSMQLFNFSIEYDKHDSSTTIFVLMDMTPMYPECDYEEIKTYVFEFYMCDILKHETLESLNAYLSNRVFKTLYTRLETHKDTLLDKADNFEKYLEKIRKEIDI